MNINYNKSNALIEHKENLMHPENNKNKNFNIKYELVREIGKEPILAELNAYIPNFMFFLWKSPKIVSKLLLNASAKDMKENLSNLFCNNFYENILSSQYIEHNLLYLIAILLKEEIDINFKKTPDRAKNLDAFLNESSCGFLLEQLQKKKDVQTFFKTIIINIIEDLELTYANKEIMFDLAKIEENIVKSNNSRKGSDDSKMEKAKLDFNFSFSQLELSGVKDFFKKYVIPLNNQDFQNLINNNKKNVKMMEYLTFHMNQNSDKNIFSSDIFLKKQNEDALAQEVITRYQGNFEKTTNIINELFKSLTNNLYLLPYSIKCICKIIYSLIVKKYQKIESFRVYAFMSKFLFGKLFIPIFENPTLGALINTFIISTSTIKNLEAVSHILMSFVSGIFFKNSKDEESFTPFNAYFISKMPDLIKFFEEIIKVELPPFIDNYINDVLIDSFEYNYFNENPEEVVFHRSVCFTLEDLQLLLDLIDKNKKHIFTNDKDSDLKNLKITFEKLNNSKNRDIIKKVKNNVSYEIIEVPVYDKKKKKILEYKKVNGRQIVKYYIVSELSFNQKFSNLFQISQPTKYFNLPELKNMENDEENLRNNIIKVKNFFCTILYNYRMLIKTDFEEDKITNTVSILTELKKYMKSSNNIIDGTFPSQWFVNSLLDYLNKIPQCLIDDDCESLIVEIQNDVMNSMKELNFEDLSILIDKMKFVNRCKNYYDNATNLIIDINLNKKARSIVENEIIEVEIEMNYNDQVKSLRIEPPARNNKHLNYLDNVFEEPKKKKARVCNTIKMFTKYFPNLLKYQNYYKVNVLKIEKELQVPQLINKYFEMIKEHIKKNMNITDEKEFSNISDKIYDYIMEKLYEKLYPKDLDKIDGKIKENCEKLTWVEPKHFIKSKNNYVYESFLPEISNYIKHITKEKSIRKKFNNMKLIFECMNTLGKFNGEKDFSLDDQMNILNYVFIRSKPAHIYSNCEYLELFIGKQNFGIEGQNLAQLKGICQHIANLSSSELGVEEEEFNKNCAKSFMTYNPINNMMDEMVGVI